MASQDFRDLNSEQVDWDNSKYFHVRLHKLIIAIHESRIDQDFQKYYGSLFSLYMELVGLISKDEEKEEFEKLISESREGLRRIEEAQNKNKMSIDRRWIEPMMKWEEKMRKYMDEEKLLVKKTNSDPF